MAEEIKMAGIELKRIKSTDKTCHWNQLGNENTAVGVFNKVLFSDLQIMVNFSNEFRKLDKVKKCGRF